MSTGACGNQRLFVALPLPDHIRCHIATLNQIFPGHKFSANPHLTLRYIGHAASAAPFTAALSRISAKAFDLRVSGLAFLPRGILYAKVDHCLELAALKRQVDDALCQAGLAPEARAYLPHITLRRFKTKPGAEARAAAARVQTGCQWRADKFHLYASLLSPQGARHESVASFKLY